MKPRFTIQLVCAALLTLLSLSHWFPFGVHFLELLGAFAHFTLFLSISVVVLSFAYKLRFIVIFALISTGITGTLVVPHFLGSELSREADFSIGQYNVWHHNTSHQNAILSISENAPDIFVIQELNASWSGLTDSLFSLSHPFSVEAPMEECCYGIGLFSKYPIVSYNVLELEETPVVIAQLDIDGLIVTVISVHTRPPAFPNETTERNNQLRTVASIALAETSNCIVIGDLNVVPWDGVFKDFLRDGNLTSVRSGFHATYPMDFGIPLIPIDHVTYSGNLAPTSLQTINIEGSDHRGLVAGFKFKN